MIRLAVILILSLIIANDTFSQYDEMKSHIGFGIGINTLTIELSSDPNISKPDPPEVFSLTYDHKIKKFLSIGTIASWQAATYIRKKTDYGKSIYTLFTGLSCFYHYNIWDKVDLFSGIRAGYMYVRELGGSGSGGTTYKDIDHLFGYQLTIIGIRRYGERKMGFYSEIALGNPYFFNIGLTYKFNNENRK